MGMNIFIFHFSVGEPIHVKKIEKPTQEDIDDLHQKFIKRIEDLFESQKENYLKGNDKITLEII